MAEVIVTTERLRLMVQMPAEVLAGIEALSPVERAEVSPDWLARVRNARTADPWVLGFSIEDRFTDEIIGSCGFRTPPDAAGLVEVAYGINPAHHGRGYATEACAAMVRYALGTGRVRTIHAHTRSENIASERVLMKCGFERLGEVIDPEDGRVCRWVRS